MITVAWWALLALADLVVVIAAVRSGRRMWTNHREVRDLKALGETRYVDEESVATGFQAVNDIIERGMKALDALDRKAAIILPALGVAAAITVPRINPGHLGVQIVAVAGINALASATTSFILAVLVIVPRAYSAGVDPVDAALEIGPTVWDLAAPALIVREAGGSLTDFAGRDSYTGPQALASNGPLHPALVEILS